MDTRPAGRKSIPDITRDAVDASKKWVNENVVQPVAEKAGTVTGQAALEEVRAYMAENEVLNTALVTRVKASESDNIALQTCLTRIESRVRSLTILGLVLAVLITGLTFAAALHWIAR